MVDSIQRFNKDTGLFETSVYHSGQPSGVDFSIISGEGYFMSIKTEKAGFSANCYDYKGLATPAEIAQTPKENAEAELLTVEATGAFIAPLFIFDAGSGDCPSGCIDHTYWGFSTDAAGNITYLGTGDTLPIWMPDCMEWL